MQVLQGQQFSDLFFLVLRYFFELILRLQLKVYCKSNLERVPRGSKILYQHASKALYSQKYEKLLPISVPFILWQ